MGTKVFVNLPVKDLNRTVGFFSKLGYEFDPKFSDENSKCMILTDDISVMLLVEPFFKTFIDKEICDTRKNTESILSLSADSRVQVDQILKKCIAAGGTEVNKAQDMGWAYERSFHDLDGHLWEVIYMDVSKRSQGSSARQHSS
jgi:predicted lactoylglutathione lyase